MTILHRYLYNGLQLTIDTGIKPVLVDTLVYPSKVGVPSTTWTVDFGNVSDELKNAIENAIFSDPNDLYIESRIGPSFLIGKRTSPLGVVKYYLTYVFEYEYYQTFMDRELSHTVNGNDHVLDIGVTIPADHLPSDDPIVVPADLSLFRKLVYLQDKIKASHQSNSIYQMKLDFKEIYKPLNLSGIYTVGTSDANYITCS